MQRECSKLIVDGFLVELYLVELRKLKVEVSVFKIKQSRRVCGVIHGSVCLYKCRASKCVVACIVLGYCDIKVANNPFVLLELKMRPLAFVDKLLKRLLQIFEHRLIGSLYLIMIDGYLGL